jgi:hypothetical protein
MEDGDLGNTVNPWSVAMFDALTDVSPDSAVEESAFDAWLDQTSRRQEARQDRVHGAEGIMPWPMWLVLLVVAAIIFGFMMLFADSGERAWVQAIQIGAVIAVITSTILVIQLLNTPFQDGPGGLEPVAMERVLDTFDQIAGLGIQGDPPCSDTGEPV